MKKCQSLPIKVSIMMYVVCFDKVDNFHVEVLSIKKNERQWNYLLIDG